MKGIGRKGRIRRAETSNAWDDDNEAADDKAEAETKLNLDKVEQSSEQSCSGFEVEEENEFRPERGGLLALLLPDAADHDDDNDELLPL